VVAARVAVSGPQGKLVLGDHGTRRSAGRGKGGAKGGATGAARFSGAAVRGPSVVTLPDATMVVDRGWSARPLAIGGWLVERR
jgi:hypothetical protein